MPQPPATSFADELAALRAATTEKAAPSSGGDDFGAELASLRTSPTSDHRSGFARAVDFARTPLVPQIATGAHPLSRQLTEPRLSDSDPGLLASLRRIANLLPGGNPLEAPAWARGASGGMIEGAGEVATGMTSPLDLVLLASGLKSVQQGGKAIGAVARGVNAVGSTALAARGAERAADAESFPELGVGLLEAAGGLGGLHGVAKGAPPPKGPQIRGRLMAAPTAVTPAGEAIRPGSVIPMRQAPDGAFAAELSAMRRAVPMGRSASGEVVYAGDPNAVAVAPGPRALLPERSGAPRFHADEGGVVTDAAAGPVARELPTLDPSRPATSSSSRKANAGALVPARVMDREFEGARVVNQHYSSDPTVTTDAPKVQMSDVERAELRRILKEMESSEFQPHTFNPIEIGHGGAYEVVGGAAGAPVFHDITQGRSGTRGAVTASIEAMLEGKHSAMGQRALDVARGRLKGEPQLSRPILPPDAGDLRQSGEMTDADFTEFDRFVNRLADDERAFPSGEREPGQEGFTNTGLLMHVGGAVAGGAAGAASGETTEERIRRGLAGAALGATLPATFGQGRGARIQGRLSMRIPPGAADALDGRLSNVAPSAGNRPTFADPLDATYARVLANRGGQAAGAAPDGVSSFATTARKPAMPDQPHADPLAGTEVFLQKFPEQVRSGIRQILEDNHGFEAQRRGVVDPKTTARLAEGVAVDLSRSLKAGTALNAQGVRAYADALAGAQDKINTLSRRVTAGTATDADVLALEQARAEAKTVAASIMGGRSEAGRALAEFKVLARVLQSGNPQQIREAADTLRGEAAQFAEQFAQLPDDPMTRYRWLQNRDRPTFTDRTRSYFYSNILSGVKTHERNVIGNASNALLGMASQPFGAAADVVRSKVRGVPREVLFSELKPQAAGALIGIPQGIHEMLYTLKHGVSRAQLSGALSAAEAGKLDLPHVEFGGGGANPFNWPMRGLNGADQFFRAIGRNQELYGLAFHQAKREGLTGAALTDRMAHLVSGTDEVSQALQDRANVYARRAVFQEQPGRFAQGVQTLAKQFPSFSFVVPFIKTPANIIRQGFEFSPAGFVMKATRQGGRPGAQAMGRAVAGTVGLGYFAYLAASGRLSGSGPPDPAARAQLMESGWRPNSVKVGDQWISYFPFQPISTQAAAVADAFDAWRDAGADADLATKAAAGVARTLRSQLNQSFLSGLADFVSAIEYGESATQKAGNVAGHTLGGFVPLAGALRTATAAIDPMVRHPKGVAESVATGLPGLSAGVPARLDRFGHEVAREGGPVRRVLDPFNVSTETDDPVLLELGRLGVKMGMPSGVMTLPGEAKPTREESRGAQQIKGQAAYALLQRVMAAPGYQQLRDDQKADVLERAITRARELAGKQQKGLVIRGRLIQQGAR